MKAIKKFFIGIMPGLFLIGATNLNVGAIPRDEVLPELQQIHDKYVEKKANIKEIRRFEIFSRDVMACNADYKQNLPEVDDYFSKLKKKDIREILNNFGTVKLHGTAIKHGSCLRIWVAANWTEYKAVLDDFINFQNRPKPQIVFPPIRQVALERGIVLD